MAIGYKYVSNTGQGSLTINISIDVCCIMSGHP